MLDFTRLRRNTKKDFSGLKRIKVALLSDSALQLLHTALKGFGYERGLHYDILEGEYNGIESAVMNPQSRLYAFDPAVILLIKSTQKLLSKFYGRNQEERTRFADEQLANFKNLIVTIADQLPSKIILFTIPEKDDRVYGNYANKLPQSFLYQVRKLNLGLMELAQKQPNFFVCDVQQLVMETGMQKSFDAKNYFGSDMVWSLDFLPLVAKNISGIIEAFEGRFKKCLVVDLDNTLWGGVIGDDGMAGIEIGGLGRGKAFTALQQWIKELKTRGIIVCVCSKNTEAIAREPFESHPEMVLRLEDIAVFSANWENKVDNLHFIQQTLNIGFDAMVFLDDNPFERGMVKEAIPELEVPELPDEPADYLHFLQSLNLFETVSLTSEDAQRVKQYQEEAKRSSAKKVYQNEDDFLASLQMTAQILALDSFTVPRAAQLSQRSNQFNLRTVRYSENDLERIIHSPDHSAFVVKLADKFGDYGIISFVVLKAEASGRLFIESWMMSCRVLKRGVERLVLNTIAAIAKEKSLATIMGEYIATAKNALVKDHYQQLGFVPCDAQFCLPVAGYENRPVFIEATAVTITDPALQST